ncbi:MAG TPA: hypothetical protein VFI25_06650 [Planctomycetota bacterium]|nr:hypothetical protein [Planctomycetota bacterium]
MTDERHPFFTDSFVLESVKREDFSWILLETFRREELEEIARKTGVRPYGGVQFHKMSDWELSDFVADLAYDDPKSLKGLCRRIRERLPEPLLAGRRLSGPQIDLVLDLLPNLPYETTLPLLVRLIGDADPKVRARAADLIRRSCDLDEEAAKAREAEEKPAAVAPAGGESPPDPVAEALARAEAERERAETLARERARGREETERSRRALDEMRIRLGEAKERIRALEEEVRRESEARREADRRAAEHKRVKEEALAPTEREAALRTDLEAARREIEVRTEKVEWLEEQLALALQEEEEGPAKPGETVEEDALAARAAAFASRRGRRPSILVIGGARKQYSHKPKFDALKSRVAIEGEWEWADYDSWHRRMQRLRHDMERRHDGLVILHWNRTTFTEKAREAAERADRLHRTVQYRGFLSLRRGLLDLLRQILDREETKGG